MMPGDTQAGSRIHAGGDACQWLALPVVELGIPVGQRQLLACVTAGVKA